MNDEHRPIEPGRQVEDQERRDRAHERQRYDSGAAPAAARRRYTTSPANATSATLPARPSSPSSMLKPLISAMVATTVKIRQRARGRCRPNPAGRRSSRPCSPLASTRVMTAAMWARMRRSAAGRTGRPVRRQAPSARRPPAVRLTGPTTSHRRARTRATRRNMATPPMTGTSPGWVLRPPGTSTRRRQATGRSTSIIVSATRNPISNGAAASQHDDDPYPCSPTPGLSMARFATAATNQAPFRSDAGAL